MDWGRYYVLQIFRYDQESAMYALIFEETISEDWHNIYPATDERHITNYIDILYSSAECINSITVQEGVRSNNSNLWENEAIKPKENAAVTTYIFNAAKNKFE